MSEATRASLLAEDDAARDAALDVARSFIVQAPAGSGKTELLIQRLLALLAVVERPERVLAITFTRKAAGEMRDRVVRALTAARDRVDEAALKPHERATLARARAALAQDARHGWNLVLHPSRLAIRTIDSLAQGIALQAPLASGLPPAPRFTEDAMPLYRAAAQAAIAAADANDPRWRALLMHQDNDAGALATLLAGLLARRDQWRTLVARGTGSARAILERTLVDEIAGELDLLRPVVEAANLASILPMAGEIARALGDDWHALRDTFDECAACLAPPPLDAGHLDGWREIARWLLTRNGKGLRKQAARMPGVAGGPVAQVMQRWLGTLGEMPGLEDALRTLVALPPARYTDEEWSRIEALLSLLPEVAAHLELAFAQRREIDFPKATLAALDALGERDAPGDLLLRIDQRVDHVLVDEFQDTSYAHLDLIGRLVAGWSPGDGKTLFAVGDPMQSIYKFRGAEVRAFVEAQLAGAIEGVAVEPLTLRRNFRSQPALVDWVNARFGAVLGRVNEPWQGRVAFAEAIAGNPSQAGAGQSLDVAESDAAEAGIVVERVREALAAEGSVAILVRARTHLDQILPALRRASIPYAAIDVDTLGERPAVSDVVALAHAIVQPADRLAWLALLRAPWCGLTLADLHAIVRAADAAPARSIADVVLAPPETLSADGAQRVAQCAAVVARARATHGLAPLAERVREAWIALAGPATVTEPLDLVAVDEVLALIAAHERAGEMPDWSAFVARLAEQKLAPPPGEGARVQVMTMHKAKGLEFDTVILPGLGRTRTRNDTPFLRWRTRRNGLLLGLAKPRGGEPDGVYAYLQALGKGEDEAELARLAYVACTRAKRRLAMVAQLDVDAKSGEWKFPGRTAMLGLFEPSVVVAPPRGGAHASAGLETTTAPLERLPAGWRAPIGRAPLLHATPPRTVDAAVPFDWARERARRLGVVVHQLLAQVHANGLRRWDEARLASQLPRIEAALVGEGALPSEAAREADDVRSTLAAVLADARGRWLFDPAHVDARSEWAVTGVDDGDTVHLVVDRTFVANGERWIVDFKTGAHEGADPEAFLDAEVERYRLQLERYKRIVGALDPAHPIRLALYHPRVPRGWREIPA